jgi:hypothetical protein
MTSTATRPRRHHPQVDPPAAASGPDVDSWPPFTAEQAERLALLWRPGVIAAHKARMATRRQR